MPDAPRGPLEHEEIRLLLPWLANDTLEGPERARVELHLESCAACGEEVALWRRTGGAVHRVGDGAFEPSPERLERLLETLPEPPREGPGRETLVERFRAWWHSLPGRAGPLLAAQSLAVAGLAAVVVWQALAPSPPLYETLSAREGVVAREGTRLDVAFAEDATERELRELLRAHQANLVGGPSALGIYTIAVPSDVAVSERVERLRADPRVRLVALRDGPAP